MLEDEIKEALKKNKAILGFKESLKFLKTGKPRLIVIAKNISEDFRKEIEYNAKIAKVKIKVFDGSSKELGTICGKPFPVSTIVIKG